ncbi:MAG: hypothetical protein AAF716_17565 [Cyanobacteria bacterium P01_D01_bin.1]
MPASFSSALTLNMSNHLELPLCDRTSDQSAVGFIQSIGKQ